MTKLETFHKTQVKSRNFIVDFIQQIRNLLGYRLRGYEDMVQGGTDDVLDEVKDEYEIDWFRVDVDQIGPGTMLITVYGQGVPK